MSLASAENALKAAILDMLNQQPANTADPAAQKDASAVKLKDAIKNYVSEALVTVTIPALTPVCTVPPGGGPVAFLVDTPITGGLS
jgi:hypothetical protein